MNAIKLVQQYSFTVIAIFTYKSHGIAVTTLATNLIPDNFNTNF